VAVCAPRKGGNDESERGGGGAVVEVLMGLTACWGISDWRNGPDMRAAWYRGRVEFVSAVIHQEFAIGRRRS